MSSTGTAPPSRGRRVGRARAGLGPVHARALTGRPSVLPGVTFDVVDDRPVGLCPRLPSARKAAEIDGAGVGPVVASPAAAPEGLRLPHRLCVAGGLAGWLAE